MTTIVQQLHDRFVFSVSTDVVGLFGNPVTSVEFWEEITSQLHGEPVAFGLELLAWRHLPMKTVLQLPKIAERLAGCHGRIGTRIRQTDSEVQQMLQQQKMHLYNSVLHKTVPLLNALAEISEEWSRKPYLLLHEPELTDLLSLNALDTVSRVLPLGVENNTDDPNMQKTRSAVAAAQELGFEAVPVFDIAHFLASHDAVDSPNRVWKQVLTQFSEPMLVHIPIGFNVSDSLHFEKTSQEMLCELGDVIHQSGSYCTLEFQLSGAWPLYAQPKYLPYVKQFAANWLERLVDTKVISLQ